MGISQRKEREKEQRRKDIIDAAEKVFFKKGLNNSTMDEVAKEAELSKGTLYLYFKSKEDIHFEIRTRALNILSKMFKRAISENKTGFENCMEIGKAYVDFVKKHNNYYKAMIYFENNNCSAVPFHGIRANYFKENNPLKYSEQTIIQGIADGSIRSDIPPMILAQTLWAQMTGVLQFIATKQNILEFSGVTAEDIIVSQYEIARNGIRNND
ncbi:MAG: TetR/AcrR family transcriptional regulator [Bacteroidota bacterium]|nr:TetR/AcrR family transcriptional regulator [Bacteroidota bacterium]